MKVISFNANGIRSAAKKGFYDWLQLQKADFVCIQETKAQVDQLLSESIYFPDEFHCEYYDAQKKGYSGVAILSKIKADLVAIGMNHPEYDFEGRNIRVDFGDITILSTYFPSGTTGDVRQDFKMKFLADFQK